MVSFGNYYFARVPTVWKDSFFELCCGRASTDEVVFHC